MKFQRDTYSCGVVAIANALRCFGKKIPEKTIRVHTSTTKEHGTSEHGVKNALERLGFVGEEFDIQDRDHAWSALHTQLDQGHPVIIICSKGQHWMVVIGKVGQNRVLVADSMRSETNVSENGVHCYDKKTLLARWKHSKQGFYGISVIKL